MTQLSRPARRKIIFSIFIAVFLIYGNSLRNGYALDDRYVTVVNPQRPGDNPRIAKGIKGIPELFSGHYVEAEKQSFDYRPVPLSTFAIEYQFFGSNATINHFFNVLIYACSCALLFILLLRLFPPGSLALALLVTFLFLVHPIHTEVVDNIKSRDELLSFLFGLLALHHFTKMANAASKWRSLFYMALFLFLALLCKKTAFLFMGLILLVAWFFSEIDLKRLGVMALLFFTTYLLYFLIQYALLPPVSEMREFAFYENPLYFHPDIFSRLRAALFTSGYYARLLILPYPLCFYYGYDAVAMDGWGVVLTWLSLAAHGWLIFYVIKTFRQKNILSFGICVYLLGLIPFVNLFFPMVGILGERFIYFSSLGFCVMAACVIFKLSRTNLQLQASTWKHIKPSLKKFSMPVLLLFSVMTMARNTAWKDLLTLSQTDIENFPNSYMQHVFVANKIYAQSLEMSEGPNKKVVAGEAKKHFARSGEILSKGLEENGEDYFSMTTLGTMYSNYLGQPDKAMPLFRKVLQKKPGYEIARFNLGYCYELKGRPDSALAIYQDMLAGGSQYSQVYMRLHEAYLRLGKPDQALPYDKKANEKYPRDIQMLLNLGNDYMLLKDTLQGLMCFEGATTLAPGDYNLLMRVAETFAAAGYPGKANEFRQKARAGKNPNF